MSDNEYDSDYDYERCTYVPPPIKYSPFKYEYSNFPRESSSRMCNKEYFLKNFKPQKYKKNIITNGTKQKNKQKKSNIILLNSLTYDVYEMIMKYYYQKYVLTELKTNYDNIQNDIEIEIKKRKNTVPMFRVAYRQYTSFAVEY